MRRKAISPRDRFEILKRDGFACVYCGAKASPEQNLVIDHLEPHSKGGASHMDNYVVACQPCNAGKSDKPLLLNEPVQPEWGPLADALCDRLWANASDVPPFQIAAAIEVASLAIDGPGMGLSQDQLWDVICSPRLVRILDEWTTGIDPSEVFEYERFTLSCWLEIASKRVDLGLAPWRGEGR